MRRVLVTLLLAGSLLVISVPETYAIDHGNLDEGRPLQVEDSTPIAAGEWAIDTGVGVRWERERLSQGFWPIELLYGAALNLQVGFATRFFTTPTDAGSEAASGDVQLSALYNFNQETITVPALGLRVNLVLPTGVHSTGPDLEMKGLMTRSLNRLRLYFNPSYTIFSDTPPGERDGRYRFIIGISYPVGGAPKYTYTTVITDVLTEQAARTEDHNVVGAEFGIRHQWSTRVVLDVGLRSEFAGPDDRAPLSVTTGLSIAF